MLLPHSTHITVVVDSIPYMDTHTLTHTQPAAMKTLTHRGACTHTRTHVTENVVSLSLMEVDFKCLNLNG